MSTKKVTTAEEAYLAAVKRASAELFVLQQEMEAHVEAAKLTPSSWRPVSDMSHVADSLASTRRFLKPTGEAS